MIMFLVVHIAPSADRHCIAKPFCRQWHVNRSRFLTRLILNSDRAHYLNLYQPGEYDSRTASTTLG